MIMTSEAPTNRRDGLVGTDFKRVEMKGWMGLMGWVGLVTDKTYCSELDVRLRRMSHMFLRVWAQK